MTVDGIPLPDPVIPACSNCRWNVNAVCTYIGFGNSIYPKDWKGKPITWNAKREHCGQHQYRKTQNENQNHE